MKFGRREEIRSITLEDVTIRDPGGVIWIEDANFKIEPGASIWVRGELNAGMFLRVLAGLLTPTTGRVLVNGKDIHEMDFEEFLPYRLNIGYTFNLGGVLNNRTIKENLMLPFLYHGAPLDFAEAEVQEIIELFDLHRYENYRPAGVPGVVRKLCCIGRALAITPQVLLLDDPTSSMKPQTLERLIHWIDVRRKEAPLSVVVASEHHDLLDTWNFDSYKLENGRLKEHSVGAEKKVAGL